MANFTKRYRLGKLKRGSLYSARLDARRFLTLDYNMESYVGVIGVGVISGWEIDPIEGLQVQILPGRGVIKNFSVESDYFYKQRSEMLVPEREIEVINSEINQAPYPDLTPTEREQYVSVIQDYDPTFDPVGPIENSYVKVVTPKRLELFDNGENFIYAKKKFQEPYPLLEDYPVLPDTIPRPEEYPNYNVFLEAKAEYDELKNDLQNYEWRNSSDNHFTAVDFFVFTGKEFDNDFLLLGKITTRLGEVVNIDYSGVLNLQSLENQIQDYANLVVENHRHGGNAPFDPPKVSLKTELRKAVLLSRDGELATYQVVSSAKTDVVEEHQHTYIIDEFGKGFTVDTIGNVSSHFHIIENFAVGPNELSVQAFPEHRHVIPLDVLGVGWDEDADFVIKVNGEEVVPEIVNASSGQFALKQIVGTVFNSYSISYSVVWKDVKYDFDFSGNYSSVFRFMLAASIYYDLSSLSQLILEEDSGNWYSLNPFAFESTDDNGVVFIEGVKPLLDQSLIATQVLIDPDDKFMFTPNAARNLVVTLENTSSIVKYDVTLEVLGESEVTGRLNADNVLYLNANKINLGVFEPEQIPFVNHVGRINEVCHPIFQRSVSKDAITYEVVPNQTAVSLDHSHNIIVNSTINGITNQVFVGEDPVFYGTGYNGVNSYFIAHTHSIGGGEVLESESDGLLEWQRDLEAQGEEVETAIESSSHSHDIIFPESGNPKTIYSIQENKDGDLYLGTPNGFYMIPYGQAYSYVVNGERLYYIGDDLWELLLKAKSEYEENNDRELLITESIYGEQIEQAYANLISNGDSFLLKGQPSKSYVYRDEIMIQRLDSFLIPNMAGIKKKFSVEVSDEDVVVDVGIIIDGEEYPSSINNNVQSLSKEIIEESSKDVQVVYYVLENLNEQTFWSSIVRNDYAKTSIGIPTGDPSDIPVEDLFLCSGKVFATQRNLKSNFQNEWFIPDIPNISSELKKIILDEFQDLWIVTNNMLLVSRSDYNGRLFEIVEVPGFSKNISGLVNTGENYLLCSVGKEIYRSINRGKDWNLVWNSVSQDVKELIFDPSTKKTYAVLNDRRIIYSSDDGLTWNSLSFRKFVESTTSLFVFNNVFLVGGSDGLYIYHENNWKKVLDQNPYSFSPSYDSSKIYIGCHNALYETYDGLELSLVYQFEGNPLSIYNDDQSLLYDDYTYNTFKNAFIFKNRKYPDKDSVSETIVNVDRWYPSDGPWNEDSDYEVLIDEKLVFSTVSGLDLRGSEVEYFEANPKEGFLDFSVKSNLVSEVNIYDNGIEVEDGTNFSIGDQVVILSEVELEKVQDSYFQSVFDSEKSFKENPEEKAVEFLIALSALESELESFSEKLFEKNNMFVYGKVALVSGNFIFLENRFDRKISLPAYVRKIPKIDSTTLIEINIFESKLINSGKKSHDEIEDSLSKSSDFRPYLFNNAYLSNILQLTQAVRYVYPQVGLTHRNNLYYDFHYSEEELAEKIDLLSSERISQVVYQDNFLPEFSRNIFKVFIGSGKFENYIFAGTDIGLFVSKIEEGLESNWFYINDLSNKFVYEFFILDEILYAGTSDGIYTSENIYDWISNDSPAISYPIRSMNLRWKGSEFVDIPSHNANFRNDDYTDPTIGYIDPFISDLYSDIQPNSVIRIFDSDLVNGQYFVKRLDGDRIVVEGGFQNIQGSTDISGIRILQAAWWKQFEGDEYVGDADITNVLLAGGVGKISYLRLGTVWNQSNVIFKTKLKTIFSVFDFEPLSTGRALASVNGSILDSTFGRRRDNNFLLSCKDIGATWKPIFDFHQIEAKVISSNPNSFNNTEMVLEFIDPSNYSPTYSLLNRREVVLFFESQDQENFSNLGQSYILINYLFDNKHTVIVEGIDFHNILSEYAERNISLKILISPMSIAPILELPNKEILLGSNQGLYSDQRTLETNLLASGFVNRFGEIGSVSSVNIEGIITFASSSFERLVEGEDFIEVPQLVLSVDRNIGANQLAGNNIYLLDVESSSEHKIFSNFAVNSNNELTINISRRLDAFLKLLGISDLLSIVGQKVIIQYGENSSLLKVNFDVPIKSGQFENGTLFITSDENNNIGSQYKVLSNTSKDIIVEGIIKPPELINDEETEASSIIIGQRVSLFSKEGELKIYLEFNQPVKPDQLVTFGTQSLDSNGGKRFSIGGLEANIISNEEDSITIDERTLGFESDAIGLTNSGSQLEGVEPDQIISYLVSSINQSSKIFVLGFDISEVNNFNSKLTSIVSDHYHDLDLIGDMLTGSVNDISLGTTGTIVQISNLFGWSDKLIQYPDLINGAFIRFYNPRLSGVSKYSKIIEISENQMRVQTNDSGIWDDSGYNPSRISSGWLWESDLSFYGVAKGTYYSDFTFFQFNLIENSLVGDSSLFLQDTSAFAINEKIQIVNSKGNSQITYVADIIDGNEISLKDVLSFSFFVKDNSRVKVLRDDFSNDHIHLVKNNQVQNLSIEDYNERGYPLYHSHRCLPLVNSISEILNYNDGTAVIGSNSKIYESKVNLKTWSEVTDLNDINDGGEEVENIVSGDYEGQSGIFLVATKNGNVFSPLLSKNVVKLEKPKV